MTAPIERTVCQLTGQKSGVPAVLAAADEIAGNATEVARLRRDVEMLTRQLDGMFEAHTRLQEVEAERDHFKALCHTYSDEVRSLNLQLDSMRAAQPKRSGW